MRLGLIPFLIRRLTGTQLFAIFVTVVVVVVVVYLLASGTFDLGGSDDTDPLAATTAEGVEGGASVSAGSAPPAATHAQAAPFDFGDLRVVVTEIHLSVFVSEGRDSVEAIERFATVLLTVRNNGPTPLSLDGALLLIDGAGRTFSPNMDATAATARRDEARHDALAVRLQPGITTDLLVVFEVPEEAGAFRLRLSGGFVDVLLDE